MSSRPRAVSALIPLFFLLAGVAYSQPFPKVPIDNSQVRTMKSASTGRNYDLYIYVPSEYEREKAKKYPVLYILDGQWDFKLMHAILGGLAYDKFVPEMIMVGVTYSGENADYNNLRAMDYTPVAVPNVKGSGDGPKFHKFLKTELMPFIEANYRTDPSRRYLQGSSYAGLFTLYALFAEPELFAGYVAASPAVTYADGFAFKQEAAYSQAHKELPGRLYLAVGGAEGLANPVKRFMETLQSRGYQGLTLETRVLEGERHASNKPELFNRGLRFLFSK